MLDLLLNSSDDQTAIIACLLTIAGAALLVFASYHLGPAGQKMRNRQRGISSQNAGLETLYNAGQSHDRAA